jgi:cell division protein ZapA (FtsZ GTPase activity inhibitor)
MGGFALMDAEQTVVTVDIYGVQYKLKGHSNVDYMKRVASSIDESMKKLAKGYPRLDMPKLAVLSAVQITEEVFRLRRDNTRLQEEEAKLQMTRQQLQQIQQQAAGLQAELAEAKRIAEEQLRAKM